jgi:adenine/guanine phosphoribosyltransferase-like PRPP-binding protein
VKIEIPIKGKREVKRELLRRTFMPREGWLDINDGIVVKLDSSLLAGAVTLVLKEFYKRGVRDVEILVTCEAAGNALVALGVPIAHTLGLDKQGLHGLTFRKSEKEERPMFDLYRHIKSPSHGDRTQIISAPKNFLAGRDVLMLDDVLRKGRTAGAIKDMTEEVGGSFLGLGVLFRKMWLKDEQLKNLPSTQIVSLIELPSPSPEAYHKLKLALH